MKITSNKKSIELVNNFLNENNDINEIIQILKEEPNSSESKKLWKKFKNILEMIGRHVIDSTLESLKCLT